MASSKHPAGEQAATLEQLICAVHESLHRKGVLNKMRAMLRAEITDCLERSTSSNKISQESKDAFPLQKETIFINNLILEYFAFNGYEHAASILNMESSQTYDSSNDNARNNRIQQVDRNSILEELGLCQIQEKRNMNSTKPKIMPILYSIIALLKAKA